MIIIIHFYAFLYQYEVVSCATKSFAKKDEKKKKVIQYNRKIYVCKKLKDPIRTSFDVTFIILMDEYYNMLYKML